MSTVAMSCARSGQVRSNKEVKKIIDKQVVILSNKERNRGMTNELHEDSNLRWIGCSEEISRTEPGLISFNLI